MNKLKEFPQIIMKNLSFADIMAIKTFSRERLEIAKQNSNGKAVLEHESIIGYCNDAMSKKIENTFYE